MSTKNNYSGTFNKNIYNIIEDNKLCLDIGSADGLLGKNLILNKSCVVDCVDNDINNLNKCINNGYRKSYLFDLDVDNIIIQDLYDVIILGDVLEHLKSPENLLIKLHECLKKDGLIIVSIPNVAFIINRANLLFGRWNYTKYGILDYTHLKFYTKYSFQKMLSSCNYKISSFKGYNQYSKNIFIKKIGEYFPTLFAFQFLFIIRKC